MIWFSTAITIVMFFVSIKTYWENSELLRIYQDVSNIDQEDRKIMYGSGLLTFYFAGFTVLSLASLIFRVIWIIRNL